MTSFSGSISELEIGCYCGFSNNLLSSTERSENSAFVSCNLDTFAAFFAISRKELSRREKNSSI